MKKIVKLFSLILLSIVGTYLFLVWQNNRGVEFPTKTEYTASFEKSIGWLQKNRNEILASTNSMLWWMIKESADLTNDPRLVELYSTYKKNTLDKNIHNVWRSLFDMKNHTIIDPIDIAHFPDYNQHFLYGTTCSRLLEQDDFIQRQLKPEFCNEYHPISPACVTHQLMGMRFMQRHDCGDQAMVETVIVKLQDKIVTQLTWDLRVVDVYLQRVLMLLDSGAREQIKPVWIRTVINAQLNDGGWGGSEALFPVGREKYFAFTSQIIGVRKIKSDFHASAQGLLIMSMLVSKK